MYLEKIRVIIAKMERLETGKSSVPEATAHILDKLREHGISKYLTRKSYLRCIDGKIEQV